MTFILLLMIFMRCTCIYMVILVSSRTSVVQRKKTENRKLYCRQLYVEWFFFQQKEENEITVCAILAQRAGKSICEKLAVPRVYVDERINSLAECSAAKRSVCLQAGYGCSIKVLFRYGNSFWIFASTTSCCRW